MDQKDETNLENEWDSTSDLCEMVRDYLNSKLATDPLLRTNQQLLKRLGESPQVGIGHEDSALRQLRRFTTGEIDKPDSLVLHVYAHLLRYKSRMELIEAARLAGGVKIERPFTIPQDPKLSDPKKPLAGVPRMAGILNLLKDVLYRVPGEREDILVKAVQLSGFGADSDYIGIENFRARYTNESFRLSPDLVTPVEIAKQANERQNKAAGKDFFDGPNTRLLSWATGPENGPFVALEENCLRVELGPVGWYDFSAHNRVLHETLGANWRLDNYRWFTGIQEICDRRELSRNKCPNIVSTATTILTEDGFVGYTIRGHHVSADTGKLTSSIAEGINRYLDDAEQSGAALNLYHPPGSFDPKIEPRDVDYIPVGTPNPFAAVRRGLVEEVSPALADYLPFTAIKLTGLSFDLLNAHPDFLFVAPLPLTRTRILEFRRSHKAKTQHEGTLEFVPADFQEGETRRLIAKTNWIPGGLASLVRTIQIIEALKRDMKATFADVFCRLRN